MLPLVYLGTSSYDYILKNLIWSGQIMAFMVPCQVNASMLGGSNVSWEWHVKTMGIR